MAKNGKKKLKDEAEDALEEIETNLEEDLDGDTKNQTELLIDLVLSQGSKLFHDQFGMAFVAPNGHGGKIIKLRSREFKTWLAHIGWKGLGKPITAGVLQTVVTTLEGDAVHEGEEYALSMRVANYDNALWYDLGDGRAVKIDKQGWEVVNEPPILFYRQSHQKPQPTPVKGGKIEEVFSFLPEPSDGQEKLLLIAWLVTAVMQGFSHPILVLHGEKGSCKTTVFKLLRRLLDPSQLETLAPQGDLREFIQMASHNYFLPLDNLSPISSAFSDILCRVVTGEGFSKRELFSDDDDIVYSFQRVVGVNGINLVLHKPDVLDRSLLINLEPPKKYEGEEELYARFEQGRPRLLGTLFDTIALTIKHQDKAKEVQGLEGYRMAGFAKWGCAVVSALGMEVKDFIAALEANRQRQQNEVMDTSPVAMVVARFMALNQDVWQGTPTELLKELRKVANQLEIDPDKKPFPQDVNWLWKRLEEVVPNLREQGIVVSRDKDNKRSIHITKSAIAETNVDNGPDGKGYDLSNLPKIEEDTGQSDKNQVPGILF